MQLRILGLTRVSPHRPAKEEEAMQEESGLHTADFDQYNDHTNWRG